MQGGSRKKQRLPYPNQYILDTSGIAVPNRIMPLGDSITQGLNDITNGGWRKGLDADLVTDGRNVLFVGSGADGSFTNNLHEGHSGYFTSQILTDLLRYLDNWKPDVVLLMIGTNDCATGDITGAANNLALILDVIHRWRFKCWINVANCPQNTNSTINTNINTYNALIPGIVSARTSVGRRIRASVAGQQCGSGNLGGDGTHPTTTGYNNIRATLRTDMNAILNTWV